METSIGVFLMRTAAEEAVKELLSKNVPKDSIVFLTRSNGEVTSYDPDSKDAAVFAGAAGGATGLLIGATTLLAVPGIGDVVAVGYGALALLGLVGAGAGVAVTKVVAGMSDRPHPTADEESSEDATFFREVLRLNRSLVLVRTDSQEIAKTATEVLDRLGLEMEGRTSTRLRTAIREVGEITVVDVGGSITFGVGNAMLREIIQDLLTKGRKKIILNLAQVEYIDSAGIGELIFSFTAILNQGGQMKLVNLNKNVRDLLAVTNLHRVFDIHNNEPEAIKSFGGQLASGAVS
jgi:anti-sigma B factor antagonist